MYILSLETHLVQSQACTGLVPRVSYSNLGRCTTTKLIQHKAIKGKIKVLYSGNFFTYKVDVLNENIK